MLASGFSSTYRRRIVNVKSLAALARPGTICGASVVCHIDKPVRMYTLCADKRKERWRVPFDCNASATIELAKLVVLLNPSTCNHNSRTVLGRDRDVSVDKKLQHELLKTLKGCCTDKAGAVDVQWTCSGRAGL